MRIVAAALGGAVHETAQLLLPRFVRSSRLYEATAKNLLRVTIGLVGGVDAPRHPRARRRARASSPPERRQGTSSSSARSPPSASHPVAARGSVGRHPRHACLPRRLRARATGRRRRRQGAELTTVDELLGALEGATGTTARLIDVPPLEVAALRQSLSSLREDATGLPTPTELRRALRRPEPHRGGERRSLLEVSVGMGIAFFNAARKVGRQHLLDAYTEDLRPVRDEGFGAYAARLAPVRAGGGAALRSGPADAHRAGARPAQPRVTEEVKPSSARSSRGRSGTRAAHGLPHFPDVVDELGAQWKLSLGAEPPRWRAVVRVRGDDRGWPRGGAQGRAAVATRPTRDSRPARLGRSRRAGAAARRRGSARTLLERIVPGHADPRRHRQRGARAARAAHRPAARAPAARGDGAPPSGASRGRAPASPEKLTWAYATLERLELDAPTTTLLHGDFDDRNLPRLRPARSLRD